MTDVSRLIQRTIRHSQRRKKFAEGGDVTADDMIGQARAQLATQPERMRNVLPDVGEPLIGNGGVFSPGAEKLEENLRNARLAKNREGMPDVGSPLIGDGGQFSPGTKIGNRLFGTGTEERFQTWPENMARSGTSLAGDILSGNQNVLPPGLRREDYTDVPPPSGPTEDSTWLGRKLGLPPVGAQPNDQMMERAQDMAGLAGGQTLLTGAREAVPAAVGPQIRIRPLSLAADSQATGAPLAALEHAPKFYSHLEQVVDATPITKATGEQWLGTLTNKGAKPEEMDWTGLRSYLAENTGKPVTKAQVQEHLGANKLELGEVESGWQNVEKNPKWQKLMAANEALGREHDRLSGEMQDFPTEAVGRRLANIYDEMNANHDAMRDMEGAKRDPQYSSYVLPGGEKYRERLLKMPTPNDRYIAAVERMKEKYGDKPLGQMGMTEAEQAYIDRQIDAYGDNGGVYRSSHWTEDPNTLVHRRSNERTFTDPLTPDMQAAVAARHAAEQTMSGVRRQQNAVASEIRQTADTLEQQRNDKIRADFEAGKISGPDARRAMEAYGDFPELVPLQEKLQQLRAHEDAIRSGMPEEPKPNSKRALHIEEIQSDWHQAGRKAGYKGDIDVTALERKANVGHQNLVAEIRKNQPNISKQAADSLSMDLLEKIRDGEHPGSFFTKEERALGQQWHDAMVAYTEGSAKANSGNMPPNAPFRKNWHELALKDAIREAAEKGFDRISWTPGEAQAARYDLSKHLNEIVVVKDRAGPSEATWWPKDTMGRSHGSIRTDADGNIIKAAAQWGDVAGKNIADVVGKDVAERGLNSNQVETRLSGVDLQVGGEGMKGFYDKIIPDALNKIGKPHGVKVQKGSIGTDRPGYDIVAKDGSASYATYKGPPTQEQLQRIADQERVPVESLTTRKNKGSEAPVHYMDIPQSLKDQALKKGFSLFEDSATAGAPLSALERAQPREGFGKLGSDPKEHALTVNQILDPKYPSQPLRSRNVENIAADLEKRGSTALRKLGVKEGRIEGPNPRTDELLSRAIASEIKAALGRGKSAEDWYTHKIAEAMGVAEQLHPELKNDPHQKMGFTSALAITSQGETVASNVRLADWAYDHFKKTGRFPEEVTAKTGVQMGTNFKKLNLLLDELGPEGTQQFLHTEFTVKELNQLGYDVGKEKKQTKVFGSAILGPKIGQGFFQNLNGNYNPVTMDLWFMRAWGRMTGTLVGKDMEAPTTRLTMAMREKRIRVPNDPDKLLGFAEDVMQKHEKDYRDNRPLYDSGRRKKSELTLASDRYIQNLRGINETPSSGGQRDWMRSVVGRARDILEGEGHKVTNADLQAIWWYPEKELYGKLGGRDSEAINVDYASALQSLANKRGAPNEEATGAVRSLEHGPGPAAAPDVAGADALRRARSQGAAGAEAEGTAAARAVGRGVLKGGDKNPAALEAALTKDQRRLTPDEIASGRYDVPQRGRDTPPGDNNKGTFRGKPVWSGAFDPLDGHIIEAHPYEKAQQADFHHQHYFSRRARDEMVGDHAQFFWIDKNGQVQTEWRAAKAKPEIIQALEQQLFDPKGKPAATSPPSTPQAELQNWFGGSKIVDADGKPMAVFHGTNADKPFGKFKTPAYFTNEVDFADRFGKKQTVPVYLKIERPYEINGEIEGRHFEWDKADIRRMKKEGYDGVVIRDPDGDVYTPFDADQIRPAPAETTVPARARSEFNTWFKGSKAVEPDGTPAVVYRGEHGDLPEGQQFHSRLNSLTFSTRDAANTYATSPNRHADTPQAPRVSPVHLKIEKPFLENRDDPFLDLSHIEKELGTKEAMRIAKKFSGDIEYTGNWDENYSGKYDDVAHLLKEKPEELKNLYFDTFKFLDDPTEVARLKKKGYDGAIHMGNGETATELEYRVFDPSQVKSAIKGFARGGKVRKAEGGAVGDDYNTQVPDEAAFQQWKALNAPDDSGVDYDLRGAYLTNMQRAEDGHMGDQFKKPNHPTFSDQSQYAVGDQRDRAGFWNADTFVPPVATRAKGGRIRRFAEGGDVDDDAPAAPVFDPTKLAAVAASGAARPPATPVFDPMKLKAAKTGSMSAMDVFSGAVENAPESAWQFAKDVVRPITHPIETATGIKDLSLGLLEKSGAIGTIFPSAGGGHEKYADAMMDYIRDRYGGVENIKRTVAKDPVGALSDASMILTGGGSAGARLPGVMGKTGEIVGKVGRRIDPLMAPVNTAKLGRWGVGEFMTHTGAGPLDTAYRTGVEGGEAGQVFRDNMRGNVETSGVVETARQGVANMAKERSQSYVRDMEAIGKRPEIMDWDKVTTALDKNATVKNFHGIDISPETAATRNKIRDAIYKWGELPPETYHTAAGFDALKQMIGEMAQAEPFGTPGRNVADRAYHAIRDEIIKQVPEYGKAMKNYEQASNLIKEMNQTLSLNPRGNIDTALRKLQSIMRNNVNTNYGRRLELGKMLEENGATHLMAALSGQSLNAWAPRGLGKFVAGSTLPAVGAGLASGHFLPALGAAAALPLMSPRLMGEVSHAVGRTFGRAAELSNSALGNVGLSNRSLGNASYRLGRATNPYENTEEPANPYAQ